MTNVAIFLAEGYEEIEAVTVIDILRRANIDVKIVGLSSRNVEGAHLITIVSEKNINDLDINDFDAFILPGGNPGYKNLRNDSRVISLIQKAFESRKIIAAICAAPSVLSDAGILKGKNSTIYPGMEKELEKGGSNPKQDLVVVDDNIITSRGPATALPFAITLVEKLVGKKIAESVRKNTLMNNL